MAAASTDPMLESLQRLQAELDAFNKSLSELCRANDNKAETLALRDNLQEYYSKLHKDLLSRYETLKLKEKKQNVVKKVPKIEPELKQTKKEEEEKKEAKKEGQEDFGGYSIPKILPIKVRSKILAFCRNSNGEGLLKYLINNRRDHVLLRDHLPAALSKISDGASVVLKAIEGFDFSESDSGLNDKKESANRRTCISLLECLFPVLGNNENAPVAKEVQDKAREMARVWRKKMGLEKSLESASKLDIQAFLQLLVTFRIGKDFGQDELCEMLLQIVCLSESPALALFLGLSPKMPDFVDKLSNNGKWIEAIRYAHAFGMMDKVKTDLLKAYLEDTEKAAKDMVKKGGGLGSSLLNSTVREIDAINTVIKVVKEYNLEDMFPLDDLQNKLQRLQQVREIRSSAVEHKLSRNQRKMNKKAAADKAGKDAAVDGTEKKIAASTPEKKMMVTTLDKEKKAAEAISDKKNDATEKERFKRPRSSEPVRGNVEVFGIQGTADLGLYRLSQRVKYDSEREMNSTAGDKEKVPHSSDLFQSNHGIYRDDHYLSSYHGDIRSALHDRLEAIRSEGVHRLSELCCLGISQLLLLGKSVLLASSKAPGDKVMEGSLRIEWPDDYILKAKLIRAKAQSMTSDIEAVSNSFITGISDIIAAFQEAIKHASKAGQEARQEILQESSIKDKAQTLTSDIESDGSMAIEKIQDGLQHLVFVVFSTTLKN